MANGFSRTHHLWVCFLCCRGTELSRWLSLKRYLRLSTRRISLSRTQSSSGPLATTSVTTNAKFEVQSPKRVQIKFEEGIIGTPQLTDSIELPENVEFLGQKIDLTPVKGLLTSLQDTASSVARTISSRPPLKFSISKNHAESWLLTTYLDDELRISRGDGAVYFAPQGRQPPFDNLDM
ncbi:UNVERIFIED_CONTAM: Light-induced protein, chloroplastic [Sesamum radiatum]|uniref:Light-induced protein, chloroplastic n=1 Tax=Sesamum radiatum TaxID=300843 RepID=A0AAW2T2C2_SESRA